MSRGALYAGAAVAAMTMSIVAGLARPDGDPAVALVGGDLFRSKGCAGCHVGPQNNPSAGVGPSLRDAPEWAGERIEGMAAQEYLAQSMREPAAFISPMHQQGSGVNMPLLQLSNDEIDALVEYLLHRGT